MFTRLILCSSLVAFAAVTALAGSDAPPSWLQQAAATNPPTYDKDVPAVVLLNDQKVTVSEDGRVITTRLYAVRVLIREGRDFAFAREIYQTDTGKVREMHAWLIRPSGPVKSYGKDETVDLALTNDDVYNEYRVKAIMAKDEATVGSVFGYEIVSEDHSIFSQYDWDFQERIPSLVSRFTLALPNTWHATSVTFNHDKIEPKVEGSSYTWELRDSPPIESEPMSPALSNLVPRVAVSYFPAAGSNSSTVKTFADWAEVAAWMSELEDSQVTVNDALAAKSRDLSANAKTEREKIQAIGRYVQSVKYISIQTGLGRGGGYRPHAATEVFAKSYGDCKDKANLMRAMLKAVGIKAYLVSIYSGDPTFVREEWPSPQQFNHCIIAVKVSDETQVPAIVAHPTLGRLLIFDSTDDNTPVGDLPSHEQGSFALVIAGDQGALLRMPMTPPEANRLEREAEVTLAADGTITANVQEKSVGQSAVAERRGFRGLSRPDYLKLIERRIARGATGAAVSKVEPADNPVEGKFALQVEFTAPRYAQLMQDRLLIFKPAILARRETLALTPGMRKQPVVLHPNAYTETVRVKLPAGFEVDEMPDAVKMEAPFGSYETVYQVKDGQLVFTRKLVVRAATIPVEEYAKVRSFFERIRAAEAAPVVLAKK